MYTEQQLDLFLATMPKDLATHTQPKASVFVAIAVVVVVKPISLREVSISTLRLFIDCPFPFKRVGWGCRQQQFCFFI